MFAFVRSISFFRLCVLAGIFVCIYPIWVHAQKPKLSSSKTHKRTHSPTKRSLLRGRILEKGKREPIEGAIVFIKKLRISTYSDAKGRYSLKVPQGIHRVEVRSIGFLSLKKMMHIKGSTRTDLYIEVDPDNPFQSIVRTQRRQKSSQQFGASREQMKFAAGALGGDPFRFFQNLPGVARAARTSGTFLVRGADFADTGFFIDGHRIPILYHFGAGLTVVSRQFLSRIDFFPGGSPLRFGGITGGLISAHTRTPKITSVHGEVYLSVANAGFFIEAPLGKHWSISAAASRSYIDAFYSLITKDPLTGAFWDYQVKLAYQSKHHQFSVFFLGTDDAYNYAGKSENAPEVPLIGRSKIDRALRFLRMIAKYSYRKGPLYIRTSLATGFNHRLSETPEQKEESWDWPVELRVDASIRLNKKTYFDFGLDGIWNYQDYNFRVPTSETSGFPKPVGNTLIQTGRGTTGMLAPALYTAIRWKINRQSEVILGLRGDVTLHEGRLQWGLDPRLSATLGLHKNLKALVSIGMFHRPPLPQEWSRKRGNPDLTQPQALQMAGGLEFHYKRAINIRAQFFYNQMFGLVVPSTRVLSQNSALRPERYNNTGHGRAYGLETLVRFRFAKQLYGFVAYTLSRAERGQGKDGVYSLYAFDQPHILNLMLRWRIGAGWSVSTRFRLASGNPVRTLKGVVHDADTDQYRPIFGDNRKERLPMFHQLDLRVDKVFTFDTWKLGFYLDILNVYRAKNAEEYRYTYDFKTRRPVAGLPFFPAFGIRGEF